MSCVTCHAQKGVALVITLIMLAVITFMTVTFLTVSHRERGSVTTTTDQSTARLAADAALERAKAELLASILASNEFGYDLRVSTNFINWTGFQSGLSSFTNVSYQYANGTPLNQNDLLQNLTNLLYSPRVPVVVTNRLAGSNEFRFYLDLNRNGVYDTNGYGPELDMQGAAITQITSTNSPVIITNLFVGDPEWIGGLEHPDSPHSADNKFLYRYAYLAIPASKTLDLNYVHNQAVSKALQAANDGFMRNQGVGTWEINLAAFLYDLNTNGNYGWSGTLGNGYRYQEPINFPNSGIAFDDARALLSYRYASNYNTLSSVSALFGPNGQTAFQNDDIDGYSDGPLMTNTSSIDESVAANRDNSLLSWPGSDNTNHFFTTQELFDPAKTSPAFVSRLLNVGTNISSYDRYTFYRLLSQLGTDSASEPPGKMNLNYDNLVTRTNGAISATNFIPWTPLGFFTNAAERLLRNTGFNFGVTNIQVYPTNSYTPSVHRLLQLAANIYEATTTNIYPCIYRPYFTSQGTNIFISGYELVNGPDTQPTDPTFLTAPVDLSDPAGRSFINPAPTRLNVYGVPWVIGARKGFPNFNEVVMQSISQITRKLQMTRTSANTPVSQFKTTQLFLIGISNLVGVEVWNSYRTNYPRSAYIQADGNLLIQLTNDFGIQMFTNLAIGGPNLALYMGAINPPTWPGTGWAPGIYNTRPALQSFQVPLLTNIAFLSDSQYQQSPPAFFPVPTNGVANFALNTPAVFPQPHWVLSITNRIRCMILDGGPQGRVVDYVQLNGLNTFRDLSEEIRTPNFATGTNGLWSTNIVREYSVSMPQGLASQIEISLGHVPTSDADWSNNGLNAGSRTNAINFFLAFFGLYSGGVVNTQLVMQVPFTPTAKEYQPLVWQANDPLVHYTVGDLSYLVASNNVYPVFPPNAIGATVASNLWRVTDRYQPWGGRPLHPDPGTDYDLARKDPLVRSSDDWDFPTNKFPNIGWLGRVHRGTPWQTIYLKSKDISVINGVTNPAAWMNWSGDGQVITNWDGQGSITLDASLTLPVKDRDIFDLFTTAFNDNATRGQLSINQTGLAAWSAVFSGVMALSNSAPESAFIPRPPPPTNFVAFPIDPVGINGTNSSLFHLFDGINRERANTNDHPRQVFEKLGDILSVPELSVGQNPNYVGVYPNGYWTNASPFLNLGDPHTRDDTHQTTQQRSGLNDAAYEWLPQQVMSLLTLSHSPRFVIYSYGQALKPAPNSVYTGSQLGGGVYLGLCTNYQIMAEAATRAVVRFDPVQTTNTFFTNGVLATITTTNGYSAVVESFNTLPPD